VALSVSLAIVLSAHSFAFSSFAESNPSAAAPVSATDASQNEFQLVAASATTTPAGILLQWHTNAAADNLGFNVYRLKKDGQRTRVNREIIPGAAFASPGAQALMRAGYSYSWFDRGGTVDSTYYIESVSLEGIARTHEPVTPGKSASRFEQTPETLSPASANATQSTDSFEKYYPAAESGINSPTGAIEDQWAIAAQPALKIGIKKDGWYRVTQAQMTAAGFNSGVDIRNLRLFVEAQEVAINTSQFSGPLGAADYIEFYGRGLDTTTTDTRVYYLVAGATPGKRVGGQIQLDGSPPDPPPPAATPTPPSSGGLPAATPKPVLRDPIFDSSVSRDLRFWMGGISSTRSDNSEADNTTLARPQPDGAPTHSAGVQYSQPDIVPPRYAEPVVSDSAKVKQPEQAAETVDNKKQAVAEVTPKTSATTAPKVKKHSRRRGKLLRRAHSRKRNTTAPSRLLQAERNHATLAAAPANFDYTVERKDRGVYYSSLLNGDTENFFGQVISTNPASQTLTVPNPDLTAAGPAKLEVAMQGVNMVYHQVTVKLNGTTLGMVQPSTFFGQNHAVQTFDVLPSLLLDGANTLTLTPTTCTPTCYDITIVDYARLTYPHTFRAELAPGKIHLVSQPNVDDMLAVGGQTYTFKTTPTSNLHIGIGSDMTATVTNIANRINSDTISTLCTAVASSTDVVLSANNPSGTTSIMLTVDGVRLTKTDLAKSLKFSLRGTQSLSADGFSSSSMRLIDYTDPLTVKISRPATQSSALGFAISVPTTDPPSKPTRLLYAIPNGQFDQPASLSLNQPSSLNLNSNAADFLIISYKDFVSSAEPLRLARANQGLAAKVVDVEDVYDEFSYGEHGPQAIKDFLAQALAHWTTKPRYVVFLGDASYDARNYGGLGNFDLVPTKLIDATYNETVSDDWLADVHGDSFNNDGPDGIADIPVGRIPVRTVAEANLVISKIVNYSPPASPQSALLIADDPGTPPVWDFESGNDNVQALLPPAMTVQRVNVRTEPSIAQATADIRDGITQGRAFVNYSGHGNVNVWSGSAVWGTSDASALANGMNKLTFVVVMDCLNGYFQDPSLLSLSEAFLKAPNGGAVATFASSGLTTTFGQRQMELELYRQLYGAQPITVGDAIKIAKGASADIDVRRTWIYFGDPAIKIR
jgi:hypothetical protein